MTFGQAHDLMDLLLDKADQPYFTSREKDRFLNIAYFNYFNSAVERVRQGWLHSSPFVSKLTETVNHIATISGQPPVYSREDLQRMETRSSAAFNNFIDEFARRGQNNEA